MELLILDALKWRMRSITPFSFIHFFVSFFEVQDPPLTQALTARATEIIFKSQCGTLVELLAVNTMFKERVYKFNSANLHFFLFFQNDEPEFRISEFRPSLVAASAVLSAAHELFPSQFLCLEHAMFTCSYVDKVQIYDAKFVTSPNSSNQASRQ